MPGGKNDDKNKKGNIFENAETGERVWGTPKSKQPSKQGRVTSQDVGEWAPKWKSSAPSEGAKATQKQRSSHAAKLAKQRAQNNKSIIIER
jgi:hypothetical protein